jgi:hypothetical protein
MVGNLHASRIVAPLATGFRAMSRRQFETEAAPRGVSRPTVSSSSVGQRVAATWVAEPAIGLPLATGTVFVALSSAT